MEKLLKLAMQKADQAEVYYTENNKDSIEFNDSKLENADSSLSSGIALRVIKDGRIGLAHTRNLLDPAAMVDQALLAAKNGMKIGFDFPNTTEVKSIDTFGLGIEKLDKMELIHKSQEMLAYIRSKTEGQINAGIGFSTRSARLINSAGTDLSSKRSHFQVFAMMIFPGTGSGLYCFSLGKDYQWLQRDEIDEMIEQFKISKTEYVPDTGKYPVIFSFNSPHALVSRLEAAFAPVNIHNQISPLCNREGEMILSTKFNLSQEPHAPNMIGSTGFDDEGTPTRNLHFFEKGVFKAIPTDLNYAEKLKREPTGNGFRFGIGTMPSPETTNLCIGTGDKSLGDMISSIKKGVLVQSLMGAHSGNVLNGDFSVGVSTGFMIVDGKLVGRVKDCMLSGNVYESLNNIAEIENKAQNFGTQMVPSIMIDGVSVAGK